MAIEFSIKNKDTPEGNFSFVLKSASPLTKEQAARLKKIIEAWYTIGFYEHYAGTNISYGDDTLRGGSMKYLGDIVVDGSVTSWSVDMGSCDIDQALSGLKSMLECLNEVFEYRIVSCAVKGY